MSQDRNPWAPREHPRAPRRHMFMYPGVYLYFMLLPPYLGPLAQDSGDSEGQIGRVSASSIGRTWLPCSGLRAPASPRSARQRGPHTAPRGDCHRTSCTTVLYSPLRRCRPRGGPLRVLVVNVVAFRTRCTSKVRHSFSVLYEVSLLDRRRFSVRRPAGAPRGRGAGARECVACEKQLT